MKDINKIVSLLFKKRFSISSSKEEEELNDLVGQDNLADLECRFSDIKYNQNFLEELDSYNVAM